MMNDWQIVCAGLFVLLMFFVFLGVMFGFVDWS